MPGNIEAEAAFLGAALIDNDILENLSGSLLPEHFFEPLHQRIFERIVALRAKGETVTAITLKPYFDADPDIKRVGGTSYLARLTSTGEGLLMARGLAEQIHELHQRRQLVAIGQRLTQSALDTSECTASTQLLTDTETALAEVAANSPQSRASPLRYEWAGDAEPVLDDFWMVEDFLPTSGVATLYAVPGAGKTFLAMDIAAAVAENRPWADKDITGGPVLYIVAEGAVGFKNRLAAMFQTGRMNRVAPFAYISTAIDLQAPDGDVEALIATIQHFESKVGRAPALIVIDTLSKTFGAGKENSDDMVAYVANGERIAETFSTLVLVLCHEPHEGGRERGHSSLRGGVVTAIHVKDGTATVVKQKDGPEGVRVHFRLNPIVLGNNRRGKEVTSCLVEIVEGNFEEVATLSGKLEVTGQNKIALEVIQEQIALHGEEVPSSIPTDVIDRFKVEKVIQAGQVRDKLKSKFVSTADASRDKHPDTAKRTANRAIAKLKSAGILGSWEEWLWLA